MSIISYGSLCFKLLPHSKVHLALRSFCNKLLQEPKCVNLLIIFCSIFKIRCSLHFISALLVAVDLFMWGVLFFINKITQGLE